MTDHGSHKTVHEEGHLRHKDRSRNETFGTTKTCTLVQQHLVALPYIPVVGFVGNTAYNTLIYDMRDTQLL